MGKKEKASRVTPFVARRSRVYFCGVSPSQVIHSDIDKYEEAE
jgi:hypothetical protein